MWDFSPHNTWKIEVVRVKSPQSNCGLTFFI
jgi:hypothetical protein